MPDLKRLQEADQGPQGLGLGGGDEDQFQPGLLQNLLDLVQALPASGLAQGRRLEHPLEAAVLLLHPP